MLCACIMSGALWYGMFNSLSLDRKNEYAVNAPDITVRSLCGGWAADIFARKKQNTYTYTIDWFDRIDVKPAASAVIFL